MSGIAGGKVRLKLIKVPSMIEMFCSRLKQGSFESIEVPASIFTRNPPGRGALRIPGVRRVFWRRSGNLLGVWGVDLDLSGGSV